MLYDELIKIYGPDLILTGGASRCLVYGEPISKARDIDISIADSAENVKRILTEKFGVENMSFARCAFSSILMKLKFTYEGLRYDIDAFAYNAFSIDDIISIYTSAPFSRGKLYHQNGIASMSLVEFERIKNEINPDVDWGIHNEKWMIEYCKRKNIDVDPEEIKRQIEEKGIRRCKQQLIVWTDSTPSSAQQANRYAIYESDIKPSKYQHIC